jgi:hypothetical protein
LSSVCCRSTGIRTEQNSEPLFRMVAAFESRIGAAPVCAKSTRKVFRVLWGALAMGGDDDGDEPWSEDDLFDLDSALSFGAHIEEIAVFLRREVEDVERKAFERTPQCSANPGLTTPNRLNRLSVDFEKRPAAPSEGRKPLSAGARNPIRLADPERSHQALEDQSPEAQDKDVARRRG